MKKSVLITFFLLLICASVAFANGLTPCGGATACACGNKLTSSRTFDGTDSLTNCSELGLKIEASNVILDCNGYKINSSTNVNSGILMDLVSNVTIINCEVNYFQTGIHASNSEQVTIRNNVVEYNGIITTDTSGLHFDNVSSSNVTNNSIRFNDYGIYLNLSNRNIFTNNNISNNTWQAVFSNQSGNNTFVGGEISNNNMGVCCGAGSGGMFFSKSPGTIIKNAYLHDNFAGSIYAASQSNDFLIENNTFYHDTGGVTQIDIRNSNDDIVRYNNITNGTGDGIRLILTNRTQVKYNTVNSNGVRGVLVSACDGSQLISNNINNNNDSGIAIYGGGLGSDHTVTGNTVIGNCATTNDCAGLYADSEDNTTISQNTISMNFGRGIMLSASYNMSVTNNNLSNNTGVGIKITSINDTFFGGNNTIRNNTLLYNNLSGIAIDTPTNIITGNTIIGADPNMSVTAEYESGITIRGSDVQHPEDNFLSGNKVSGYRYGLYVLQNVTNLTASNEHYFNNTAKGIHFNFVGTADKMPLIANSLIENNCEGIGLFNQSFARIEEMNILNNTCSTLTGLLTFNSHAEVLNGNFENNGIYGILDQGVDTIEWLVTKNVACTNNNIQITSGFIIPFGGQVIRTNCSIIFWNGTGYETLADANVGRYVKFISTTNNTYTLGAPEYGFIAQIFTNASSSGKVTINFYNQSPGNQSVFKIGPLGIWIDVNVTGNISQNLDHWVLRIYYTDAQLAASGLSESSLKLSYFNPSTNSWEDLPTTVNAAQNYIEATITHFSIFGVFGSTPSSVNQGGGSGGRGGIVNSLENLGIIDTTPRHFTLNRNKNYAFTLKSMLHHLNVISIDANSRKAKFKVQSSPIEFFLNEGNSTALDLDNDGSTDITFTLDKIKSSSYLDLTLYSIPSLAPAITAQKPKEPMQQTEQKQEMQNNERMPLPLPAQQVIIEQPMTGGFGNELVIALVVLGVITLALLAQKQKKKEQKSRKTEPKNEETPPLADNENQETPQN